MKAFMIIILGIVVTLSPAFAQKVYLLTSLKVDRKPLLARANWDYNLKLENIFLKKISDLNYTIEVRHQVTLLELQMILTDENTAGIFWVSHGRSDVIKDMYGNNVKTLFLNLNKNIRFLALVSCNGESVLKELEGYGLKKKYPNLITFGENSKVIGTHFLKKSIKVFRYYQNRQGFSDISADELSKKSLTLTRELTVDSGEISVTLDDQFILGIFPAGKAGEE